MPVTKKINLEEHINLRVRILLQDSRILIGLCKAVDKHMNFVLDDCVEITKVRTGPNKQVQSEKLRQLGFVLLRGKTIVSVIREVPPSLIQFGPPPISGAGTNVTATVAALPNGPQKSASVGRTSQMRVAVEGRETTLAQKKIRPVTEKAVKEEKDVADVAHITLSSIDAANIELKPEMFRPMLNGNESQ